MDVFEYRAYARGVGEHVLVHHRDDKSAVEAGENPSRSESLDLSEPNGAGFHAPGPAGSPATSPAGARHGARPRLERQAPLPSPAVALPPPPPQAFLYRPATLY